MRVDELQPSPGANRRRKRMARGIGGAGGKTHGRGTKGQKARGRGKVPVGFEGGQMPLKQRVPKLKGFNNPFRVEYQAINLDAINDMTESVVNPATLYSHGLSSKGALVKVLARGEINRAVKVSAHGFSASARAAIEAAGGSVEMLPLPYAIRPPAKGNQFTNR
jgi:large subunit ribosomal protein L15